MSDNISNLDNEEVKTTTSKESIFEKEIKESVEKIETKASPAEKKPSAKTTVDNDRVIYSTKTGIIPNFGQINKGYTKLDKNKAKVLVNQYSFIRYASEEEIATYVN